MFQGAISLDVRLSFQSGRQLRSIEYQHCRREEKVGYSVLFFSKKTMSSGVYSETTNTTEREHEGLINGGENDRAKRSENSTPMLNSNAMIPATTPEHALLPLDGRES
jgi:hypothetical protein